MTTNRSFVRLSPYDPHWEVRFNQEKEMIIQVIGPSLVGIEHIGSTSVKGLGAKPIIDLLAGVKDLEEVPSFIEPLKKIDYEYVQKPELTDRRFFRKGKSQRGTCHLHICEFETSEWNDKLLFRNYLRTFPEAAVEYGKLKKELAKLYQFDRPKYTQEKEPFIREIIRRAKKQDE